MSSDKSWEKIFHDYKILEHDFKREPFVLSAPMIKTACQEFTKTSEKEVRILCKQDYREARPQIMIDHNLFLLPIKNGTYVLIKGEGYVDIPTIKSEPEIYSSKLEFPLDTLDKATSEMQHLDLAYAASLIRYFFQDSSLVLTIRGRKFTGAFDFYINKQKITVQSVQTEVDAGYEGNKQIVLLEAKNGQTTNLIIRQLFFPYRQWSSVSMKTIRTVFFEKREEEYFLWEYAFKNPNEYNSIELVRSKRFIIEKKEYNHSKKRSP